MPGVSVGTKICEVVACFAAPGLVLPLVNEKRKKKSWKMSECVCNSGGTQPHTSGDED
jgi:hypothetical protein